MKPKKRTERLELSVIAPVYNEEGSIKLFHERIAKVLAKSKTEYELLFVNDGSTDSSLLLLLQMAKKDKRVKVINFSRNFGHQIAVSAGLDYAKGNAVVVIDSDLQDPPEVIPALIEEWRRGFDVVSALRRTRKDGFFKKFSADMFYKFLNMMLSYKIPENVGDFRLLDKKPVEILKMMRERDRYIRGMTNWIGFTQTFVKFDRDERHAGTTNYPFKKMAGLAANALFSFSDFPMKLAYLAFAVFFLISLSVSIYALVMRLSGEIVPGWTFQVLLTVVFGAIQMFVVAIISEYVGRIYKQGQARPLYIVSDVVNIEKE